MNELNFLTTSIASSDLPSIIDIYHSCKLLFFFQDFKVYCGQGKKYAHHAYSQGLFKNILYISVEGRL